MRRLVLILLVVLVALCIAAAVVSVYVVLLSHAQRAYDSLPWSH